MRGVLLSVLMLSACVNYGRFKGKDAFADPNAKPQGARPATPAQPQAAAPQPGQPAPAPYGAPQPAPVAPLGYAQPAAQPQGFGAGGQGFGPRPAAPPGAPSPTPPPAGTPGYAPQPHPPPQGGYAQTPQQPAYAPQPPANAPAAYPTPMAPGGATPAPGGQQQRIQPEGTHASLLLPAGWSHRWGMLGSERVYVLEPNTGDRREVAVIGMRPLSPSEASMPMQQLLPYGAQAFGIQGEPLGAPAELDIHGKRGGRMVVRQQGMQGAIDSYLGAVLDQDVAYVLLCSYRPESSRAAVLDAILQSMQVQAPPDNHALAQQLVGCWNLSSSSGGGNGYAFSETRWFFEAGGSYRHRSTVAVSVPGASGMSDGGDEVGRYRVRGNVLSTQPQNGEPSSYDIALSGGVLQIGQDRFLPCR